MGTGLATAPASVIEAEPVLVRSTGIFAAVEEKREALHGTIEGILRAEGVRALNLQSAQCIHPCWLKVESWLPVGDRLVTDRSSVVINIEPKPFHVHELEYTVRLEERGVVKQFGPLYDLGETELRALVEHQLRKGPKPSFKHVALRKWPWQFWRPKNKVNVFSHDWAATIPNWILILGFVTLSVGIGVVFIALGIFLTMRAARRPLLIRSGGRPEVEPRDLIAVDSWQAMVPGESSDLQLIRDRFLEALNAPSQSGFRHRVEKIWYWGINGKVEREQIVVSLARALCFCHIYSYSDKLYVGWDSHLNRGAWAEKTLAKGYERDTCQLVTLNAVVRGWQQLNEYDVTDANLLTEWCHAQMMSVLKTYLKERDIDAEIDFKILRGERQGLTGEKRRESGPPSGWFKRNPAETVKTA